MTGHTFININRPVCFIFERARAPINFSLDKGNPYGEIVNFYWSISRAPRQLPGDMEAMLRLYQNTNTILEESVKHTFVAISYR